MLNALRLVGGEVFEVHGDSIVSVEVDGEEPCHVSQSHNVNRAMYHNLITLWLRPSVVRVGACLRTASSFSAAAWNA